MNLIKNNDFEISIITVCFNSEKTIRTTLESVKNQSLKNIEHIIIDGSSDDNTLSIIKKYPHVSKIISEKDKGVYDAMNKGVKVAKGRIIGFLNSDDFYTNDKVLSKVSKTLNLNNSLEACYSNLIYVNQYDISKNIRFWKSSKFIQGSFSKGWCPPHPTFFALKSVYERFGNFNLDYKLASDNDIMMRFLEINKIKNQYIPEVWVKMRLGGNTNKNFKNIFLQNLEILKALRKNGMSSNSISFFLNKTFLRLKQIVNRDEPIK